MVTSDRQKRKGVPKTLITPNDRNYLHALQPHPQSRKEPYPQRLVLKTAHVLESLLAAPSF